jgi:two-component system phosphate regulon sensor histidine kinase PhoR
VTISTEDIFASFSKYSADGILVADLTGAVVACNSALGRLLGREATTIIGQCLYSLVDCACGSKHGTEDGGIFDPTHLVVAQSDNAFVHNATVCAQGGANLAIPVSHSVIYGGDGATIGYLTCVYVVQAGSVQQAQTEFVSTVSHELRTPLTSIKGFADTILRAGDRLEAAQQKRYVGIIKDQADRLTRLVEDLLAVSRLEARKLQFTIRAIDLGEAVHRVCQNLQDKARNHKIVTSLPKGLPHVWADADRLEQILTNLVDNAIKYSPADSQVTIVARELNTNPEMVEIAVTDQGGGIAPEHVTEIFNKFTRLDNPLSRQTEGTGLGLYITKSLVQALGGQIRVTSNAGETTFTVQLPAASLEEQAARGRG